MAEDHTPVCRPRRERLPAVDEGVGKTVGDVAPRIDIESVEARQTLARQNTVIGRVVHHQLEAHSHLARGGETHTLAVDGERTAVGVEVRRGGRVGRLDEVAQRVCQHQRREIDAPHTVGLGRSLRRAARAEAHRRCRTLGRVRGVAAAHVEALQQRPLHEAARGLVSPRREERPHQRPHTQEGVVVPDRTDTLR